MKEITREKTINLIGGASEARCQRIQRRMRRASSNGNYSRHRRLSDRHDRLC